MSATPTITVPLAYFERLMEVYLDHRHGRLVPAGAATLQGGHAPAGVVGEETGDDGEPVKDVTGEAMEALDGLFGNPAVFSTGYDMVNDPTAVPTKGRDDEPSDQHEPAASDRQ